MIRAMNEGDFSAVVALNQASVAETSALDRDGLAAVVGLASRASVSLEASGGGAGAAARAEVTGFLLALRESAAYVNPNFEWFRERYPRFLYVDRIVVRGDRRGSGVGSRLYADVEDHARKGGVEVVTCEVDLQPANPRSLAFHARRGFVAVGKLVLPARGKVVSMLVKQLERKD